MIFITKLFITRYINIINYRFLKSFLKNQKSLKKKLKNIDFLYFYKIMHI